MAALRVAGADIIFLLCGFLWPPYVIVGHYIFVLWFLPSFFIA